MKAVQDWIVPLGTVAFERAIGIATDGTGNVYVCGHTYGDLAGASAGGADAWVAKYDSGGRQQWAAQLGSSKRDLALGVAVDGSGNVYVAGGTEGAFGSSGTFDAWLAKFDATGARQWIEILGTSAFDQAGHVAVDAKGNVYVSGATEGVLGEASYGGRDAWLARYDTEGVRRWTRQLGSSGYDTAARVATGGNGNVYLTGVASGAPAGPGTGQYDAWVASYDAEGKRQWVVPLGTPQKDGGTDLAVDAAGSVYVSGATEGALEGSSAGGRDAWLAKFDADGVRLWVEQLGTPAREWAASLAVDASGSVYVGGLTKGALEGSSAGGTDAWLARYSTEGVREWLEQLGTPGEEYVNGIAADGGGYVYVCGQTSGALAGASKGGWDAWLARYHQEFESINDATPLLLSLGNRLALLSNR